MSDSLGKLRQLNDKSYCVAKAEVMMANMEHEGNYFYPLLHAGHHAAITALFHGEPEQQGPGTVSFLEVWEQTTSPRAYPALM